MAAYEIRSMTEKDIPQIAGIEKMVFTTPWSEAAFRSELADNTLALYLVLTDEEKPDEVLAYGGIWKIFDEGHITNIAVRPDYQGRKLGKMLLQAMIRWGWTNGMNHMTLEVRVSNQIAINLYKKTGFAEAGIRPGYYDNGGEDAIIMWLRRKEEDASDAGGDKEIKMS
ncbi:MAG: ribosomal protein S18-alanine N-acetyltransferase [Clostridiales bacterium]|nr:ribosomal protein S18-alanine N-acetyltransferase [Clostridiales bacterium]